MKATELLKGRKIKDTLFEFESNDWIKGGLSKLMEEFSESQNKELIEEEISYLNNLSSFLYGTAKLINKDRIAELSAKLNKK